jgi:hypothetical protein
MRAVLLLFALIVVVGVGLGVYLGWFKFSSRNDKGRPSVTVSVDKGKMATDNDSVLQKAQDLGNKVVDKVEEVGHKAVDKVQDLGHQAADKVQDLGHQAADKVAATTQKSGD